MFSTSRFFFCEIYFSAQNSFADVYGDGGRVEFRNFGVKGYWGTASAMQVGRNIYNVFFWLQDIFF